MKNTFFLTIVLSLLGGIIGALGVNLIQDHYFTKSTYQEFYDAENEIMVSPHGLRKSMIEGTNNMILVDLRSEEEYITSHIIGAVNVPAYKDPDTSAYGDVERITQGFIDIQKKNPDKDIVVYCYSISCGTARKVGQMLANAGINVKHLGIGWNEWKYDWNGWNHEGDWNTTKVEDYISSGTEPGILKIEGKPTVCPIDNEFGC